MSLTARSLPLANSGQTLCLERGGDRRLERDWARAEHRSGQRQSAAHHQPEIDLGHRPALQRDRDVAAVVGEAGEVARDIVAADHVEDDIDAAPAGDAGDLVDEVARLVVDRVVGAEAARSGAFLRRPRGDDYGQPERLGEQDRGGADAAGAAVDEDGLAGGGTATVEQVRPHGEIGLGQAGGGDEIEAFRDRQALAGRGDAIVGVAAAGHQRANPVANLPPARADDDFAGDFEAHDRRRARRHRVQPLPLQDVGAVDPGSVDPDQHLVRRRGPGPDG